MATNTTNNYFSKPTVGGDTDIWGTTLNANWDAVDSIVTGGTQITRLGIGTTNSTLPLICNAASATDIAASFSGSVGIGTASPDKKLHVKDGDIRIESSYPRIYLTDTDSDSDYSIVNNNGAFRIYDDTNSAFRMVIDSAGSVGIGTTNPSSRLAIHSAADVAHIVQTNTNNSQRLEIGNAYSLYTGASGSVSAIASDSVLAFATADAERMRINASGVGIGTQSPDRPLDITDSANDGTGGLVIHSYLPTLELDDISGSGTSFILQHDATNTLFKHDTTERMRITDTGVSVTGGVAVTGNATFDNGTTTTVNVLCDDGGNAELRLMGGNQGTGRLFVGQASNYGGGIEYNGDSDPVTSGAGSDQITLFRRSDSTNHWTARNSHGNNDWEFRGKVKADSLEGTLVQSIFNQIYPVGVIYISITPTSPATLFGGTWTAIGGSRVLQTVGGTAPAANSYYSENSRGITESNMPTHDHMVARNQLASSTDVTTSAHTIANIRGVNYGGLQNANFEYDLGHATGGRANCGRTSDAGSGTAFNVQQASFGVYMWRRDTLAT